MRDKSLQFSYDLICVQQASKRCSRMLWEGRKKIVCSVRTLSLQGTFYPCFRQMLVVKYTKERIFIILKNTIFNNLMESDALFFAKTYILATDLRCFVVFYYQTVTASVYSD